MALFPARRWVLPLALLGAGVPTLAQHTAGTSQELPPQLPQNPHPVRSVPGPGAILSQSGFASNGVQLLSQLSLADFGPQHNTGNDCWGYISPAGRQYALMGLSDGTGFVDVTDPGNPQIINVIAGPSSLWRDVKVYGTHAYSVSEGGGGIQVFDLSTIDLGTVNLVNTVTTGGVSSSHNVAIDEVNGFLYRLGGASNLGMRAYSLANPANPTFVGQWNLAYIHDAQFVTYTSGPFAGRQIAFACTSGTVTSGLDIIDVTNKSNIFRVTRAVYGNPAFSHQVWLSPDLQYAYLNDELDENGFFPSTTIIFDVSDINNPFELPPFNNGNTAITHNMYTRGNFIYQANYTSGLRIYDATNPTNLSEVAWFDTFPGSDPASFDSLWSVFPYFTQPQLLAGSDLQSGLFMFWQGAPELDFVFNAGSAPVEISPGGQSALLQIQELASGDLQAGTAMLNYDIGAGPVSVPLTSLGGLDFSADFPAQACGTAISYYITAESASGITWSSPQGCGTQTYQGIYAEGSNQVAATDFEVSAGWVSGAVGDTATTGIWTRGNPIGTAAQPEDDHTPTPGTQCWFTGQGSAGGSIGENDIDGGATTLLTPNLDMSALSNPVVRYWRWYVNSGNGTVDDVFRVDVSNNGTTWVNVETLSGSQSGGWVEASFSVEDYVALSSTVRVRFVAEDTGGGSIVEAAIDDFSIDELICDTTSFYCSGKTTSQACVPFMTASGTPSVSGGPFNLFANNHVEGESAFLIYSFKKANLSFHGGKLCVKSPFVRIASLVKATDGTACTGCAQATCRMFKRNFNQYVQTGIDPLLTSGQTVFTQWRQRDQFDPLGFGDNLSDGATFTIGP